MPRREKDYIYLVFEGDYNSGTDLYEPRDLMDEYEYRLGDYRDEDELIEDIIRGWDCVEIDEDDLPGWARGVVRVIDYPPYGDMETVALFIAPEFLKEKEYMTEEEWKEVDPRRVGIGIIMRTLDKVEGKR